jgi:hypothetical protein
MKKYQMLMMSTMLVFAFGSMQALARAAEVLFVQGNVQVQSPTDEVWKKAEKGMQLNIGDTVRTARHSKIDIALDADKKNTIQLSEKTLAVLNSATADNIDRLDLSRGRVLSNMEGIKAGFDFEVTTPSAVAGVRGSSYMVYAERDQDEVAAYKDTVFIKAFDADKNQLMEMMLPEGFKTFIERFQEPSALLQVSLREFSRFDNVRNDLISRSEGREPIKHERENRGAFEEDRSVIEKLSDQASDQGTVLDQVTETKDTTEDRNAETQLNNRLAEPVSEYH